MGRPGRKDFAIGLDARSNVIILTTHEVLSGRCLRNDCALDHAADHPGKIRVLLCPRCAAPVVAGVTSDDPYYVRFACPSCHVEWAAAPILPPPLYDAFEREHPLGGADPTRPEHRQ